MGPLSEHKYVLEHSHSRLDSYSGRIHTCTNRVVSEDNEVRSRIGVLRLSVREVTRREICSDGAWPWEARP